MAGEQACPVEAIDEQTGRWMRLFGWLRREGGGLWYPGSVGEQPARDVRALERLGWHVARAQAELAERQREHLRG